jgi:hypothetical protein
MKALCVVLCLSFLLGSAILSRAQSPDDAGTKLSSVAMLLAQQHHHSAPDLLPRLRREYVDKSEAFPTKPIPPCRCLARSMHCSRYIRDGGCHTPRSIKAWVRCRRITRTCRRCSAGRLPSRRTQSVISAIRLWSGQRSRRRSRYLKATSTPTQT